MALGEVQKAKDTRLKLDRADAEDVARLREEARKPLPPGDAR